MKSKLIVMLTHNDRTVRDAAEVFSACSGLPVEFWGFKNIGLSRIEMTELVAMMKKCGKKTFLEVVTYSEDECMEGAKLALELGFDYLAGTVFYTKVWELLKDRNITYLPFVGRVHGSPSVLEGTANDIIHEGLEYMKLGIKGFDLLAYRHIGDPETLAKEFLAAVPGTTVIAGSIESRERMQFVEDIGAWAFTMGSALFEKKFDIHGDFKQNLEKVIEIMGSISQFRCAVE